MISFQRHSVKTMRAKNKHPAMKAECLFFTARRAAWSGQRTRPRSRSWRGSPDSHLVEAMGVEQCHFIPFEKQPFNFSRIHADFQRQHSVQITSFLCTGFNSGLQNGFVAQDFLQLILKLQRGLFFLALQQVRIHAVGVHLARVPHQRLHGSFRERFCQ